MRTVEDESTYIILPQIDLEETHSYYGKECPVKFPEYTSDAARQLSKEEIHSLLSRTGWLAP